MKQNIPIKEFRGEFRFLSNFYPSLLKYGGRYYDTVEHAYQAAKCKFLGDKQKIQNASTPWIAKKIGKTVDRVNEFEKEKLEIMEDIIRIKFLGDSTFRQALIETGEAELIEGNWWGDTFWGVCKGKGENHLGKILMKIRKELKEYSSKAEPSTDNR